MNVFISWSGKRSRKIATELRTWLRTVLSPEVDTWVSGVDIAAGARWDAELRAALAASNFGIFCITEESLRSPWLLYEAGVISKHSTVAAIVPYLLDVPPEVRVW